MPGSNEFGAKRRDQFFQARKIFALHMQPLEFGEQPPAYLWRELRQVLLELVTCTVGCAMDSDTFSA